MKKGFTLIELLAVIVILAIITLIATPIILGIVNNTKEEANKRSVEMYAKAVENAVAKAQLNGVAVSPGVYSKDKLPEGFEINYDGDIECETIGIGENGNVYVADCETGGTVIEYTYGDKMYKNGEEVYFDVTTGKVCTNYHEDNSLTGYNGIYEGDNSTKTTNNQNGCLKFYAFNDTGKDTVNLLLDHNTTAKIAWTDMWNGYNTKGPNDVIKYLYEDTKLWKGTETPNNYTMIQTNEEKYTIEYSKTPIYTDATTPFKTRLITAQEIAKITIADIKLNWSEQLDTVSSYYLDGANGIDSTWKTKISKSKKASPHYWLYDRTNNCENSGCDVSDPATNGYWTSSSRASYYAWIIIYDGKLNNDSVNINSAYGVRPVIEVLRNKINNK